MKGLYLLGGVFSVIASGCIIAGTPVADPVFVYPGETKSFRVATFPATSELVWVLDGTEVQSGGDTYVYTAPQDPLKRHTLMVREPSALVMAAHAWEISNDADTAPSSANNPHVPSAPGPWFEGWYTRVSDVGGSRSLAVIGASCLPQDQSYTPGEYLPGYINVLISEGDGAPTRSFTVYPERTLSTVDGEPVTDNPGLGSPARFEWTAEGYGTITQDRVDIAIPGVLEIHIRTENRLPFNTSLPDIGPYGELDLLPLPLSWWIHSLGSDAAYRYTIADEGGTGVSGTGYAHLEKNWGAGFPIGWVWAQGIAADNQARFVVSTAEVDFSLFVLNAWIAAYRSPTISWDFRFSMPGVGFYTERDACAGTFVFEITDATRVLSFAAVAPPDTFGEVSTPSEDGFAPQSGGESFSATMAVEAYVNGTLADQRTFYNAALEFGTGYMCQEQFRGCP